MTQLAWLILLAPFLASIAVAWWRTRAHKLAASRDLRVGLDGAELARELLKRARLESIEVGMRPGLRAGISIRERRLSLRPQVYEGRDLVSLGEVLHEVGHVLQAAEGDKGLVMRLALRRWLQTAPLWLGLLALALAVRFHFNVLALSFFAVGWGLVLMSNLMALPLELDASRRGRQLAVNSGLIRGEDELLALGAAASSASLRELGGPVAALRTLLDSLRG